MAGDGFGASLQPGHPSRGEGGGCSSNSVERKGAPRAGPGRAAEALWPGVGTARGRRGRGSPLSPPCPSLASPRPAAPSP